MKDTSYGITVKGEAPTSGWVVIKNGTITNYSFVVDEYVVTKGEDTKKGITATEKPSGTDEVNYICKRATTLHTEVCNASNCVSAVHEMGDIITYGNKGTSGSLTTGDAFDCDVDGDGNYDPTTERFYYLTDMDSDNTVEGNEAVVLVYYNNTVAGVSDNRTAVAYYGSAKENWHGPVTAITNLPTVSQWKNISLLNTNRAIITQTGEELTKGGTLPSEFSYMGYAARMLTTQEIEKACNITVGSHTRGELDVCEYLLENTKYASSEMRVDYWLENPYSFNAEDVWHVYGYGRNVSDATANNRTHMGVRPVIEILKSNISY